MDDHYLRPFLVLNAGGGGGIAAVGDLYDNLTTSNSASFTDVTIPSGATLAVISISGFTATTLAFSDGSLSLDGQSATLHAYQQATDRQQVALWTVTGFVAGTGKTLAWDLGGGLSAEGLYYTVRFFSGVDTSDPVRSSGSESVTDDGNPSAGTLTAQSGDYAVGIFNSYGTGSSASWTGLTTVATLTDGTNNATGNSNWAENSSVSGNLAVSCQCASCSNYAAVAALILRPE